MAVGRVQRIQRRHGVGDGGHLAIAQLAQLIQQRQGPHAIDQGVGRQAEADTIGGLGRLRGRDLAGGGLHRAAQVGQQRLASLGRRLAPLGQGPHVVLGRQDGGDQRRRRGHLALAHAVEGGLAMMSEGGQGVEAEHGPRSLQGMQVAEHSVDQRAVARFGGQVQQTLLDLFQQLLGLQPEDGDRVVGAHAARTFLTTWTSCSGWKGLVSQPVAPAARA